MARPVNADAQATQAKILQTAYGLFAARGIDGASIRDIAKGAGVSLAMVHHYFGSKQGLYEACIDAMLRELGGLRQDLEGHITKQQGSLSLVIAGAVRLGYRFAREHRTAVRLLQRSLVDTGELDTKVREQNVLPFLEVISEAIAGLTGRPAPSLRLPVQSSMFLVVRYAITSDRELALLVGTQAAAFQDSDATPAPVAAVEEHLAGACLRLMELPAAAGDLSKSA